MIGVLSDAHGNGPAFGRAIELLRQCGVTRFIYLGDAVGYIPSPAVVLALRTLGSTVGCIRGNHEEMLLNDQIGSPQEEIYRIAEVRAKFSAEDLAFVASWPTHRVESINGFDCLFVHGSPDDFTRGYVWPDTDLSTFHTPYDFVFMGHSHHPFIRGEGNTCYVNVGSCGMPRDDGRYGACATMDPDTGKVRVLRFDISAPTQSAITREFSIHPSVSANFERRRDCVFGQFVDGGI